MHMADALLSPAVGAAMYGVTAVAVAKAVKETDADGLSERKLPLMAVSGAFVFAAQMINFTIPGTGSSGHICGGIMLAGLLGGGPALLTIASVLLIQCLVFADGGLLALGANIFNMGVVPCMIIYPLVFRPMIRRYGERKMAPAAVLSCVAGLELGALCVVAETLLSGITELPAGVFTGLMLPIHLAIGLVEGVITSAVFALVTRTRPGLIAEAAASGARADAAGYAAAPGVGADAAGYAAAPGAGAETAGNAAAPAPKAETAGKATAPASLRKTVALLGVLALLVGGGLSLFASADPDGLEWSMERTAGTAELQREGGAHDAAAALQEATAILPDYDFKAGEGTGTSASGIVGALMTCALAGVAGFGTILLKRRKLEQNR